MRLASLYVPCLEQVTSIRFSPKRLLVCASQGVSAHGDPFSFRLLAPNPLPTRLGTVSPTWH